MLCIKCKKEITDTPFCQFCGTKQEVTKRNVKKRGNGQGSVYKRGSAWQIELNYIHDGYRIRKYKSGFKTKKEALEYISLLKNQN